MNDNKITIEVYQGRKRFRQGWRWRAIAPNGHILAMSSEAYTNYAECCHIVDLLFGPAGFEQVKPK